MRNLFDMLEENGKSDIYPYHMPGHKRRCCGELPTDMFLKDITEIDGFDNLHQPEGILKELQQRAAVMYGADESFYVVNGSTGGILSAVSAVLPVGGHLLMARNCHKSAYHAAYLRNLKISYLYPGMLDEYGILDALTPKQIERALEENPGVQAVLIVSPSYEGRIANVREIAEVVHKRGIPLIVDEAHGAHLGFAEGFAENSCQAGADIVIHSVHKTLPALTQTALLHVNGSRVDRERLKRFLRIYQTSSPSYLLMASIDNALNYVQERGKRAFASFLQEWSRMQKELAACKHLRLVSRGDASQDIGKLLISVTGTSLSGRQLYDVLLGKYRLQPEMATETYVLAMFTINDSREGYERMTRALLEIDAEIDRGVFGDEAKSGKTEPDLEVCRPDELYVEACNEAVIPIGNQPGKQDMSLQAAWDAEKSWCSLKEAGGRIAGDFINLYPPGIPVTVPGERITKELCDSIARWLEQGLTVQGVECGRPVSEPKM